MMAYSMSKTITAAALLQLFEAGRLELEGPAALLAHTAGIPNPIPLRWVHSAAQHSTFDEDAELGAVLRRHPRLSSAPGTRYAYSNIGYWLLGKIAERVSGRRFPDLVRTEIWERLGVPPDEIGFEIVCPSTHATGYLEKYSLMNLAKRFLIDSALIGAYENRWLRIHSH